ncbi:MAG: hypothetical protein HYX68_07725 [Planctomycetes bacterium]|nr:hypothetical protein [Planctomycetota bacterium]
MKLAAVITWVPILILPAAFILVAPTGLDRWAFMWVLAWTIFVGCKWLTWRSVPTTGASIPLQLGYLFAWPGLDAPAFLNTPNLQRPRVSAWFFAAAKLTIGLLLIFAVYPIMPAEAVLSRGWIGMIGIVFVLHFGVFHLLSLAWRAAGVTARPIMDWPVLACSVSDFWGKRWNTAFRDLTHRFLFRPLTARFGAKAGLAVGFLFSGFVHDLVVSAPAQGGYGGPTLFFLLQGAAILFERSATGQRLGLGKGVRGWAFTVVVLLAPLFLLFHPPFVREVIVPFIDWILQAGGSAANPGDSL